MPAIATPALSDDELVEMLSLIKGADSVELKLTIPESSQRATFEALGIDPLGAQVRLVHFYDTPDLELESPEWSCAHAGWRRRATTPWSSCGPLYPSELPRRAARVADVHGRGRRDARRPRLLGVAEGHAADAGARGRGGIAPLRKLFSKEQRAFFAEHAPEGIGFEDLSLLGPIFVLKIKGAPAGFARKMVVELWLYPDGTRILELSTKCAPAEAFQVAAESRAFLAERGIEIAAGRRPRRRARRCEFFSKQLAKA